MPGWPSSSNFTSKPKQSPGSSGWLGLQWLVEDSFLVVEVGACDAGYSYSIISENVITKQSNNTRRGDPSKGLPGWTPAQKFRKLTNGLSLNQPPTRRPNQTMGAQLHPRSLFRFPGFRASVGHRQSPFTARSSEVSSSSPSTWAYSKSYCMSSCGSLLGAWWGNRLKQADPACP